jgi:putative ABC transport system substrate-binding protein
MLAVVLSLGLAMRRRDFVKSIAASAASWPLAARAQQRAMPVIGFLHSSSPEPLAVQVAAFREGLKQTGFVEGQNVTIEYRWAHNENARLPELALDLVRRQVAVIVTPGSTPATLAAKAATTTIPIVFYTAADPVKAGLVASLKQPGGNLTGVASLNAELLPKRLEWLHQLVPTATTMALLVNPTSPLLAEADSKTLLAAAVTLGLELQVLKASTESDFDTIFATAVQQKAGGVVIGNDAFFYSRPEQIGAAAARYKVPTVSPYGEYATAGGLMSYGPNFADLYRLVGVYVGQILAGAKPADLPVQQITKVEVILNLKTARALGLTVPTSLLLLATEVIE